MNKRLLLLLALVSSLTFVSHVGMAQGLIVTNPPERARWGASLPIRSHVVNTSIRDQVAVTKLEQVFYNPYDRQMEGTYMLPVPIGATISKFSMEVDGEQVAAEMLDKKEAQRIYESIVRRRKDPGILSYAGRGLIQARIFPIEAKKTKTIRIRYEEVVPYDAGVCRYRYALATDRFCKKPIDFVKIRVKVSSEDPIRNIYSPSHDLGTNREDNHHAQVKYSDENVVPDEDFQLLFSVSKSQIGLNLFTFKDGKNNGFFLLLAAPSVPENEQVNPKNLIFVLDRSGSMNKDKKIQQAKDALEYCLRSLNREDRFAVVTFNDEIDLITESLTRAGQDSVDFTCAKIKKIQAQGGTNIDDALKEALGFVRKGKRPTYVLFLTDGKPTVGEREPKNILSHVRDWNEAKSRVFTFGVGYDVNTLLLDEIAHKNKGLTTYVKPNEDIEVSVSSMYSKIADPVLADVELDFGGMKVSKIYPKELPDIFKGSQLIVLGRYKKGGSAKVTLSGMSSGESQTFMKESEFAKDNTKLDFIPRLWAARRIGYLMDEIRLHGKNKELVDEIIQLSKKYGILTEYTSFLVKGAPLIASPRRLGEQPSPVRGRGRGVSIIGGQDSLRHERAAQIRSLGYFRAESLVGKKAVENSELLQGQLQSASALSTQNRAFSYDEDGRKHETQIQGVRYAGNQAFFQREDAWISTQFDANQTLLQIKPYSEAYFQLVQISPDVAKILALGPQVSFVRNNIMVQIDEKGVDQLTREQIRQLR